MRERLLLLLVVFRIFPNGHRTENQKMGVTSNSFNGFRCGGHAHFLVLSLLAQHPPMVLGIDGEAACVAWGIDA